MFSRRPWISQVRLGLSPMWKDGVRENMPGMSLISKLAPDRPLPRVTKSYELQFGQLGNKYPGVQMFFSTLHILVKISSVMSTTIGLCEP